LVATAPPFTPDGKILATVGHSGDLKLWDMPLSK
jgi:hypothetical protein